MGSQNLTPAVGQAQPAQLAQPASGTAGHETIFLQTSGNQFWLILVVIIIILIVLYLVWQNRMKK
jgi:uncharacterized integral membrane protein